MTEAIVSDVSFCVDVLTEAEYGRINSRDAELSLSLAGAAYPITEWLQDITPARNVEIYEFGGKFCVSFDVAVAALFDHHPQVQAVQIIRDYARGADLQHLNELALQCQPLEDRPVDCKWNLLCG